MKPVTSSLPNVRTLQNPVESGGRTSTRGDALVTDMAFRDQLTALQNTAASSNPVANASTLKFSNHAIDRMQARGIRFSADELTKIENAVRKAAAKGAKETLLLSENSALIVSVKDNKVVTVMDKTALKDNVFTNIDSTVMI
jgi:flagellar operon protein